MVNHVHVQDGTRSLD